MINSCFLKKFFKSSQTVQLIKPFMKNVPEETTKEGCSEIPSDSSSIVVSSQSEESLAGCCRQVICVPTSSTSWVCLPVDVKQRWWIMCHSVGEAETAPVLPGWLLITRLEMANTANLCWIPRFPALFSLQVIQPTTTCGPGKRRQIRITLCCSV